MPLKQAVDHFEDIHQEALEWFRAEVAKLRSGRVKPDLIESLPVEVYGSRTPLNGLASIANSDARTLVVSPWDRSTIVPIEKAITEAQLGVNPTVDGNVIRLSFASLTEEVREQTIKTLHAKAEEARVRLRQGRDEALKIVRTDKEKGDLTEDDFYTGRKKLDDLIGGANSEIEDIVKKKEEEIRTI